MPRVTRAAVAAGSWCAAGLLLTACAAAPAPVPQTPAPTAIPASETDQVSVQIRQSRADWADRVVQLRVVNDGGAALTVLTGELTTEAVVGVATSDLDSSRSVPPGRSRDFSVALGEPVCGAAAGSGASASASASVTVHLVDDAGRPGDVALAPTDPQRHLDRIHGEDCAGRAVAAHAALTLTPELAVEDRAGRLVGALSLAIEPRTGTSPIAISEIEGTVLLAPVGATTWVIPELAAGIAGPTTARLEFVPGRCDPHAVAEDKRGAYLGVHASVDGVPQPVFYLGVPDGLVGQVHDFVALACGW